MKRKIVEPGSGADDLGAGMLVKGCQTVFWYIFFIVAFSFILIKLFG